MHTSEIVLQTLKEGNAAYVKSGAFAGDISPEKRLALTAGQSPRAVVITCADSRVIPEVIFSCGLGELFTIRIAGNVIDAHQLGSIEYAVSHLKTPLVVILGHTDCGAVQAALHGEADGHIRYIVDTIREAIGEEKTLVRPATGMSSAQARRSVLPFPRKRILCSERSRSPALYTI